MIPTEYFTDMTLACEDTDEDDESDDPDNPNVLVLLGKLLKYLWSDLSLPSASDILRYILSCRTSAIYGLLINLRYI